MSRPLVAALLATTGLAGGIAACSESKSEPVPSHPTTAAAPPSSAAASHPKVEPKADAGALRAALPTAPPEPVTYDGPLIGALYGQTPIMSDMEWPKKEEDKKKDKDKGAVRIGYIRQGQKVPVLPEPHPKSNCKEGWYELVQGGFVCGRYASLDLNHPKIKLAPHPPDLEAALPYQYGYNVANGTPLYRTLPSREERVKLEPWLAPKPKRPKPVETDDETTASYGDDLDAGVPLLLAKATTTITASTTDPFGLGADEVENTTPWYLRQYDGGKPTVTLDELKGEGPVARRMVKGFFVGLDKEMSEKGSKWWRTTNSLIAPFERILVHNTASKFHGVWLDGSAPESAEGPGAAARKPTPDLCKPGSKAQVGVITFYKAKKYVVSVSRKSVTGGDAVARHTVVKLTGDSVSINGGTYDETDEGWWMKASEGAKTNPGNPPKDLAAGEKWIDVDLKSQTLVAFEGDKPVFATVVSTGKEDKTDKEKNHKTPTGTWRIREKHIAATMDGDVASDGPYSIEDVPWIMYFNGSYALHGAFWHNNFGRTRSHGCVNLAPLDARALFGWTEPRMPDSWHGVWSTPEKPGTRVVVHE
ncbi:MAG: L,D-transpeptidase family protein [Labilithrix sp.]|nr:L,D-transpeptidase family protein [Labilithrix sp.]MBX3223969.1 L,D-transpeptidase family protein [Labilithrix sp.]